jgi:MinD superfamily P-loop ATPase
MILSIASGKGGTGKTLVATSLALALEGQGPVQLLDCDVEEPNARILLHPDIESSQPVTTPVPAVDREKCTYCGLCSEICAYNAIAVARSLILTFPELCHGCGACSYVCPERAISEVAREVGTVESGRAGRVCFIGGRLNVSEAMAGPVIRAVKERAEREAIVILDSPPGTSCPVVETIRGSDFCLLVTEPTPFGLSDLSIAVEVAREIGVACGVVINRDVPGDDRVGRFCAREQIPVLMRIPFDRHIAEAYCRGETLAAAMPSWREVFRELYAGIERRVAVESVR